MKKTLLIIAVLALLLSGCSPVSQTEKPIIVTSIVPMKTIIESIAGDDFMVVALVPPGSSPASYEPTPQEMALISDATVYFTLQVPTEKANVLPKIDQFNPDIDLVKVDEIVAQTYPFRELADHHHDDEDEGEEHDDPEESGDHDPHIWLSPKRMILAAEIIQDKLTETYSDHVDTFKENGEALVNELKALDAYILEKAQALDNKTFIIYHPSYGYFADDYGFEMVAIEADGKEETAKGIAAIVEFARERNIRVIFHQAEIDSQQAQTIAEEIDGVTQMLTPLSEDYIGSMKEVIDAFEATMD